MSGDGPVDHPITGVCARADLAQRLQQLGHTRRASRDLVNALFDAIVEALAAGEPVKLRGFGRFEVVEREGHPARNPATGEPTPVPPHRTVAFRCARGLRDTLTEALQPPGEDP